MKRSSTRHGLLKQLSSIKAKSIILIIDSCYSGARIFGAMSAKNLGFTVGFTGVKDTDNSCKGTPRGIVIGQNRNSLPLDACIFLGEFDPSVATYVISARDKFMEALSPSFLSVKAVNSLEEANNCDIAVRISQQGTLYMGIDILSPQTKKVLYIAREGRDSFHNAIIPIVFSMLGEDMPLRKRLIEERKLRLAKLETKKEDSAKKISRLDKQDSAAIITAIHSDIDELPSKNARPNKKAYAIVIGIENYRQKLPKADFAVSDARLVSEYLTKVMGYQEENVVTY